MAHIPAIVVTLDRPSDGARRRMKPGQPWPRARLGVHRHEEIESPTGLSWRAAALGEAIRFRGWDGAEMGAVSRVAVMDPFVRPAEADVDSGTVGWWSATKNAEAASGTIEALISANTDDSASTGIDDNVVSRLNFPT
ncbi:MAG TPA: hypothetical protein VFA18_22155, partial [Gemmataceae bacterium]|nr:hypothetical protein [Gemmataceae bacterium]